MTSRKEFVARLILVDRQTSIQLIWQGIVIVKAEARELKQIRSLQKWDSSQVRMTLSRTINELPSGSFNVIVVSPASFLLLLTKHQWIATALSLLASIMHNKCDECSQYICNPRFCKSVNVAHNYSHVDRIQPMKIHEQVREKDETKIHQRLSKRYHHPPKVQG